MVRVQKQNTLDATIGAIRDYIMENHLKEGDVLPSEETLVNLFGVSRNILREAIRHYRTLGIITSKTKIGAVVKSLYPKHPFDGYMPFILADENAAYTMAEIRECIEAGSASMIVKRVTPQDIADLHQLCCEMAAADENNMIARDIEFHVRLLRIADNKILNTFIPLVEDFFALFPMGKMKKNTIRDCCRQTAQEHREIIAALERRDAMTTYRLLLQHAVNGREGIA